jgi:hypothetical protein
MAKIAVHQVVKRFMDKHDLAPTTLRSGGRLMLTFDEADRVVVHSAPFHRVAVTSDLLRLSQIGNVQAQEQFLERIMRLTTGTMLEHSSALAVDNKRDMLVLQQAIPADAPVESMEAAIADLLNILPFWRAACSER